MAEPPREPPDVAGDLYALVVYLHASCNRDLLDAIAHEQLSFSQLLLLDRLRGGRKAPTIRQAAALMHVTPTGASRIIDGLAARKMVLRETDDDDFRVKRVKITERGEQAIARLHACRLERMQQFAGELDAGELDALTGALDRLLTREQIAAYRPAAIAA